MISSLGQTIQEDQYNENETGFIGIKFEHHFVQFFLTFSLKNYEGSFMWKLSPLP